MVVLEFGVVVVLVPVCNLHGIGDDIWWFIACLLMEFR